MCNGRNGASLDDHRVPGDSIPSLKRHREALEQEGGFPGVFCDCSDASASFLCQLYGHLMPHISCFHGRGIEDIVCFSVWRTCLIPNTLCCSVGCRSAAPGWSLCWQCGTLHKCQILSHPGPLAFLLLYTIWKCNVAEIVRTCNIVVVLKSAITDKNMTRKPCCRKGTARCRSCCF